MEAPVKTETLMWLFPVVFMLHDFEEIIMMRAWVEHNAQQLQTRFPSLASRMLPYFEKLSTPAFALMVAEEFALLSAITYETVEWELYSVWAGILVAFLAHLIMHIAQFAAYRRYTPAIITSSLASVYCIGALYSLNAHGRLVWPTVSLWALVALLVLVANLAFMHILAVRFDRYLRDLARP